MKTVCLFCGKQLSSSEQCVHGEWIFNALFSNFAVASIAILFIVLILLTAIGVI